MRHRHPRSRRNRFAGFNHANSPVKASVDPISEPAFGSSTPHHVCPCLLCQRERRFHRIADKLPPNDRAWMLGFYDYVTTDLEPELSKICSTKRMPWHP
jgi:hypothetical protein